MAVTGIVYNPAKKKLMEAVFNLTTDTIKVAVLTSSYTPNIDTQDFFDDVNSFEISSAGYTAGGLTLTGTSITIDTANDLAYFDANDASWPGTTVADYRYLVVLKWTGTASTSPLLGYVDLGVTRSTSSETLYVQWAATGIFKIS